MKILLWPFRMIWELIEFLIKMTGRLLAAIVGVALMIAGGALTLTIVGAVVGIPLAVSGFLLFVRSLF